MADNTVAKQCSEPVPDDTGNTGRGKVKNGVEQVKTVLPEGTTRADLLAILTFNTCDRNAISARAFGGRSMGTTDVDFHAAAKVVASMCGKVRQSNLDELTDMLTAQALTMDTLFTEYTRLAACNLGQYPEAVERYTNLALKAQTGCRTTVETIGRVKRGGKQTVKVVHVHEGGQAVVADTVNNGGSSGAGPKKDEQPHGQGAQGPALLGQDPAGNGVPVPGNAPKETVPAPRWESHGGPERQPQRLEARR